MGLCVCVITGAGFLREVAGQHLGDCVFATGFDRMRGYEDHFNPKSFGLPKQPDHQSAEQQLPGHVRREMESAPFVVE